MLSIKNSQFFKGQLQRLYKLVSYEGAVKILKNDISIKVKFPRKIPKIRNFANFSIIIAEQ